MSNCLLKRYKYIITLLKKYFKIIINIVIQLKIIL